MNSLLRNRIFRALCLTATFGVVGVLSADDQSKESIANYAYSAEALIDPDRAKAILALLDADVEVLDMTHAL